MADKVTRIDSLTDAQKARFDEWRDKWIKIGLCCDPANRPRFEESARACYRFTELKPPKTIVWVNSPIVLAFAGPTAGHVMEEDLDMSSTVGRATDGKVDGATAEAVEKAVREILSGCEFKPKAKKENRKKEEKVSQVINQTWHQYMGGQFWVGGWWGSPVFVSFFREVCNLTLGPDIDARADAWQAISESAGWWWPHEDFVVVCERPLAVNRDNLGRLHCETGKAIQFRDDWGVSSWRGTVVPHEWITNRDKLDPAIALTDPSVERRRAAAEIIGWNRVLAQLKPKTIDKDEDPMVGELLSVDLPNAPDSHFLRVRCATGPDFVLPVPREMKTALEANCWTYDIKTKDFREMEVRT